MMLCIQGDQTCAGPRRNITHAREQHLAGWETAVAQLYKREQRLLDELEQRAAGAQAERPERARQPAEHARGLSAWWR